MTTLLPPAAIDAASPTSRSIFRLLATSVGATNREADTLRHALLAQWEDRASAGELVARLRSVDATDPAGILGVESRLAAWFAFADPGDGRLVDPNDPVLADLSTEFAQRLAAVPRTAED